MAMRCGIVLSVVLSLASAGCQTTAEAPVVNTWSRAPLTRPDDRRSGVAQRRDATRGAPQGTPLLANTRGGETTMIEGSGRFVGEPATGAVRLAGDAGQGGVNDGVTLNLVNVPAPQAAKTILGDILGVRYTVDPSIEGRITIQTPKPVSKAAAVDLFQSALRGNNAAIVNADGMYRIVPADQAMVTASIQTDGTPEGTIDGTGRLGSRVRVVQLKYVAASEIRRVLEPPP